MRIIVTRLFPAIVLFVAAVSSQVAAQTTLTIGSGSSDFVLQANTSNQALDLFIQSTSGQVVSGSNVQFSIGSGGPVISLGSAVGTLFDPANGGASLPDLNANPSALNIGLLFPIPSPTLDNTGTQKLATILFDTTGLSSGSFNLDFSGTTITDGLAQEIPYQLAGATTATIATAVPEPGSAFVLLALSGLAVVRRQRTS